LSITILVTVCVLFFFSSRRRHTRFSRDWSSDVCSSDLLFGHLVLADRNVVLSVPPRARGGGLLFPRGIDTPRGESVPLLTGNHATDPIIPPLRATVAPVPRPEKSPVALAERPDGLVLVIHPGTVAYEILPATIEAMQADHFEQLTTWFKAWGHGRVPP